MKSCYRCNAAEKLKNSSYCAYCKQLVNKEWRLKNQDQFKINELEYYSKNKDRILDVKSTYENNRKRTDINYRIKKTLRSRLHSAIKNNQKSGSAVRDLGCSIEQFKLHIESKFKDGMDWSNWGTGKDKWQLDHIKPLFKFDLNNRDELLIACNYTNLQPMWYKDHLNKSKLDHLQAKSP